MLPEGENSEWPSAYARGWGRHIFAGLATLALVVVAACSEGSNGAPAATTPTPGPTPTRTPLTAPVVAAGLFPPAGTIYFGAYVDTSGLVGGNTNADALSVEAELGRPLALHMQYEEFTADFSGRALQDDFATYRVPVVSWNCGVPNAQIAAGAYDSTIELKAVEAKNYGWPVFVRYMWDPNLRSSMLGRSSCYDPATDLPNNVFSPAEFIAAWDHVRSIFLQTGATNVIWLWTVSTNPLGTSPLPYYPGPSEVDWVGMDAYDLNNGSFNSTFASMYTTLATLNKPVMITETGAEAAVQQSFFTGAAATLQTQFPLVKGFLYYDGIDYVTGQNQDWRINSTAFPSFLTFANDPYLSAKYAP